MAEDSWENRPLMDLCNDAARLTRSMSEHLEQAFVPKAARLNRSVVLDESQESDTAVSDTMVRNQAAEVLESELFTEKLHHDLWRCLMAIRHDVTEITGFDRV